MIDPTITPKQPIVSAGYAGIDAYDDADPEERILLGSAMLDDRLIEANASFFRVSGRTVHLYRRFEQFFRTLSLVTSVGVET